MLFRRAALFFVLLISVNPLFGQDVPASAATAVGYEGLLYNPAAIAVQRSPAVGLGATFSGSDEYGLSATLSDGWRLDYQKNAAGERLDFLCGLAFPRDSSFHVGVRAAVDLLDFRGEDLDLATGLLWYPYRYLAVAATQERLLDPLFRSYSFGVGLRPLTDRFTLFGDAIFPHDFSLSEIDSVVGLRAEPVAGVQIGFRAENHFQDFVAGISLVANSVRLNLSLAGDFGFNDLRFGAGARYELLPPRSILEFGPKVYHLKLSRPIDPNSTDKNSLYNLDSLVTRLYQLAADRKLETLVLTFESTSVLSIDVLEELVDAFSYLKSRGKTIVSYLDSTYSEFDYLAAAAGTTVVASPYTIVPLVGVGARLLFYKNLFDKLGIDVEYARSSDYKSALDRFLREDLSKENRRQLEEYLASSYELILDILVSSRGLSRERARELVDGGPYWCEEAAELGLVDAVTYYQDFEEQYLEELPAGRLAYREHRSRSWRRPEIAVLKASGVIVNSQLLRPWHWLFSRSYITEKNLIPVLERLQEDTKVSAVILYIDSGGGDGLVSDKIWNAIMELKEEKPVVVVMGRVAASGGYYLAMTGDRVFARKTALTGSIGSYSFKVVITELLERYGITTDSVRFGENVDLFSPFTALSEEQRQRLQDLNDSFTDNFYGKVAKARSLPYKTVEEISGGRIYSGERALELGLIDEIGGVYSALNHLEQELELSEEEYRLRYYPDWKMLFLLALRELREDRVGLSRDYSGLARLLFP
jgi:protease-4